MNAISPIRAGGPGFTRSDRTAYAAMAARQQAPARAGQDVSQPVAGFFHFKLGGGSVAGGVRIWFGPPHDPVTGEELDRSWRWQAHFNGEPVDFDRVWPSCTGQPIAETDYNRLCARAEWARQHAPDSAFAERGRRYDPLDSRQPLPF